MAGSKVIILIVLGIFIIPVLAIITFTISLTIDYIYGNKLDCNNIQEVYLKASEIKYASEIADKTKGVVIIPEMNQIVANTEILECKDFDYSNYIN